MYKKIFYKNVSFLFYDQLLTKICIKSLHSFCIGAIYQFVFPVQIRDTNQNMSKTDLGYSIPGILNDDEDDNVDDGEDAHEGGELQEVDLLGEAQRQNENWFLIWFLGRKKAFNQLLQSTTKFLINIMSNRRLNYASKFNYLEYLITNF